MSIPKRTYQGSDTSAGPSASIWGNCAPVYDRSKGCFLEMDFLNPQSLATTTGWTITTVTSGALKLADGGGGILWLDSNGHNAADDGIQAQLVDSTGGEDWIWAAGQELWFEARVKMTDCATTPDQHFIGLSERDTTIIASGALDVTAKSLIGFYTDSATSTAGDLGFAVAKAGVANQDTDIDVTLEDDTYCKMGFRVYTDYQNLGVVMPYYNGASLGTYKVTTQTYIPVVAMALSFVSQVEQTSADSDLFIDWVRLAYTR